MSSIAVAGAGSFGTALAIALAKENTGISLWARDVDHVKSMQTSGFNQRYLPDQRLPDRLKLTHGPTGLATAETVLLVIPTQHLRDFLEQNRKQIQGKTCVICCKGIEKKTGLLPSGIVQELVPDANIAALTGPGFAGEIAKGLPTALTLAASHNGADLQSRLSTKCLRLYLSDDLIGAQLGGALKNVIAIACGIAMGAGLGESARAAVMTRGYAEMMRLAINMGANHTTLAGLSGLGDLALTCTSKQSRNYTLGFEMGQGGGNVAGTTIEGVATAKATLTLGKQRGIEMPLTHIVSSVLEGNLTTKGAVEALLSRPLKAE